MSHGEPAPESTTETQPEAAPAPATKQRGILGPLILGTLLVGAAAFARGYYLLGPETGAAYAAVALALLWLIGRAHRASGHWSRGRLAIAVIVAVPIVCFLALPTVFNSDIRNLVEGKATERAARTELDKVIASDARFAKLSPSFTRTQVVIVRLSGPLKSRDEAIELRKKIKAQCPAVGQCDLFWDIDLGGDEKLEGRDGELFEGEKTG